MPGCHRRSCQGRHPGSAPRARGKRPNEVRRPDKRRVAGEAPRAGKREAPAAASLGSFGGALTDTQAGDRGGERFGSPRGAAESLSPLRAPAGMRRSRRAGPAPSKGRQAGSPPSPRGDREAGLPGPLAKRKREPPAAPLHPPPPQLVARPGQPAREDGLARRRRLGAGMTPAAARRPPGSPPARPAGVRKSWEPRAGFPPNGSGAFPHTFRSGPHGARLPALLTMFASLLCEVQSRFRARAACESRETITRLGARREPGLPRPPRANQDCPC